MIYKYNYITIKQTYINSFSRYALKQYKSNIKRFTSFLSVGLDFFTSTKSDYQPNINSYESLVEYLTKCNDFTRNLTHITDNYTNSEAQPKQIYNTLLRYLNLTRYDETYDNITNTINSIKVFSESLNLALESSLIKMSRIDFKSDVSKQKQDQCLRIMIMGVFNIFSSQYNGFFSSDPKLRELLIDKYNYINKTMVNLGKQFTSESKLFLETPLKNMDNYYERYQKRIKKFDPNEKSCDAQPPNLSNIIFHFSSENSPFNSEILKGIISPEFWY